MKNVFKVFGIIALVAVIGFSACDNSNNNGGQGVAPTITTSTLANGVVGTAYSQTLAATGGAPIWSLEAGTLPTGLNLLGSGVISGTPTTVGEYTLFVRATNAAGSSIKQFSITILPFGSNPDNPDLDTSALNAVILEAAEARTGVVTASNASEVPRGREWVTENEWNAFDIVYKAAAEAKANPSSQSVVDTAKTNLQAALVTFKAAKKSGSAAAITLSGTITVKNNGQIVPYVVIDAHTNDWGWAEYTRVLPLTGENTQWSIITKPLSSSTEIFFDINGYDNDKQENGIFSITVEGLSKTVYNADVNNININKDLNLITLSGTLNLNYNGQVIPSVTIEAHRTTDDLKLGYVKILNMRNNAPWSMMIPRQDANTVVVFHIVGFDGPLPWEYDQLFALWGKDFGVKVGNQDKTDVAINLITISGTVNVTYKGSRVPSVTVTIHKQDGDDYGEWIANTELHSPSVNAPWSIVIPAYTSDTVINISIGGNDENGDFLFGSDDTTRTVKNTNVSGIAFNFIELSGTVTVTYKGSPPPIVRIKFETDSDWLGEPGFESPSANAPWSFILPAFTSDTKVYISVNVRDNLDNILSWADVTTRTVKNTSVSGIALNLIELSGTVSVTYKGNPVPSMYLNIDKKVGVGEDDWEWIGSTRLSNPSTNAPWSIMIPAFTSDTEIRINADGNDANDQWLFGTQVETRTVKNTSVPGIVLNLGNITN